MTRSTANSNPSLVWLLPNRDQTDKSVVSCRGRLTPLADVIDVAQLPNVLVLGIPEEVINREPEEDVIYAQFVRQPELGRSIFCISVRCGHDRGGRIVLLTALQILSTGQEPSLELSDSSLPTDEFVSATRLEQRLNKRDDKWSESVHHLLEAVKADPNAMSFGNVALARTFYKPSWMPRNTTSINRFLVVLAAIIAIGIVIAAVRAS